MLEVVDNKNKPLLVQLYREAKHLPHRFIVLLVQDTTGKMLLWRSKKKYSAQQVASSDVSKEKKSKKTLLSPTRGIGSMWGLLYGHVQAGEAKESTALRLLEKNLSVLATVPRIREELFAMEGAAMQFSAPDLPAPFTAKNYMSFFTITLKKEEKALLNKDLLWLDMDEINGFATHFDDMLTPITLHLFRNEQLHTLIGHAHKAQKKKLKATSQARDNVF